MIFDPPSELPTAMLVPKSRGLALVGGLQRWLLARWSWFVPRAIPVAVATASLVVLMVAVEGLWHSGDRDLPIQPPHATILLGG